MESFNRVLKLAGHHADVNWEEATAVLFYGMATVAICLMVKIFIDLSGDDGKPTRRFVHSKSLYALRSRLSGLFSNEVGSLDGSVDRRSSQTKERARFELTDEEEDSEVFTAEQVDEIYMRVARQKRKIVS